MAQFDKDSDDIKKTCETLFEDSYFRISKLKNDPLKCADELRELIRQTNMHCSIQNMSEESTNALKSQFISKYSSIVDNQQQEGLLPVISEDSSWDNWFHSFSKNKDKDRELLKAQNQCMYLIQKSLNSFQTAPSNMIIDQSTTKNTDRNEKFDHFRKLDVSSISKHSTSKQNESTVRKETIQHGAKAFSSSYELYNTNTTKISHNKNSFNQKVGGQTSIDYPMKRRIENNDSKPCYSKRQHKRTSYKQTTDTPAQKEALKNSFIPASSMYKNPLKAACNSKEDTESLNYDGTEESDIKNHPSLKNFTPKIVSIILSEIMDFSPDVKWTDIAGLEFVKSTVQEIVIWPLLRPDIFTGLRAPPRGILLFGPPGTGKTLIGKCIATESNSTFFCISASSLASKWVGESEQLVRALFAVAQLHQPAVIFIDEIDALLSQRSDQEQDHTRKLKTEFLVQFDGAKTNSERRVLVVGATNRPHELDEAARRRFVKRLYVPLPEEAARLQIVEKLLGSHQHNLSETDLKTICESTKGYSGSDVAHLCKEAAMGPIRSIGPENIKIVSLDQVRAIELIDFIDALKQVRASVAEEDLKYYLDWNKKFGSFAF